MYHPLYDSPEPPPFTLKEDALGCTPKSRFSPENPERSFDLQQAFNSPNLKATRKAMLAGERVPACATCYRREESGGTSYRQKMNRMLGERFEVAKLVAATAADGGLDAFPIFLDLRLGNSCNLQCIMCSYPVSSKYGQRSPHKWSSVQIDPYREDEHFWQVLREHAHSLRRIYFAGGEPFLQAGHFKVIDLLLEVGAAPRVELTYHSNMTVLPEGILDKLTRFGDVGIAASCDGVGPVFEAIRVGAKWDQFVANVRSAKERVRVWLSVAVQRDNVMHLRPLLDFAREEGLDLDLTNFVQWPPPMAIANLPEEQRRGASHELEQLVRLSRQWAWPRVAEELEMLRNHLEISRERSDGNDL
jgi:sulfatase maturation enzyme AslB (radical SAM superfamily)